MSGELVAFLRARLDEDDKLAQAAVIPAHDAPNAYKPRPALSRWRYNGDEVLGGDVEADWDDPGPYPETWKITSESEGSGSVDDSAGRHIARHDPARVFADIDAKRRIIDLDVWLNDYQRNKTLRLLASIYADHPNYRPEWRP